MLVPHSLRSRLITILALLVAAATASGFVMFALFQQSTTAQIGQAGAVAGRACDAIARGYRFYQADRNGMQWSVADAGVARDLTAVTLAALRDKPSIEGGMWQADAGPLAYAFPTYEGSGPKTDVPQAELPRIVAANRLAQASNRLELTRIDAPAQTLLIAACPLPGAVAHLSAWTMTRVHALAGATYWQLVCGIAILVVSVGAAVMMAGALVVTWSRHVAAIVNVLSAQGGGELPPLRLTGEQELDHIVTALNDARGRVTASRRHADLLARQVATSERLAAVGQVTAGIAHGFRNPIAAMRLKAETARKGSVERKDQALDLVIGQVDRLEAVIQRLLTASERPPPRSEEVAIGPFLEACADPHHAGARAKGSTLRVVHDVATGWFDPDQMSRAVQNLIVNALQEPRPGTVVLSARPDGRQIVLAVTDEGDGPPDEIRPHLFEPFVSGAPERAGLGLAIVRDIAAAHGGHVEFDRDDGRSSFRILVPCPAS